MAVPAAMVALRGVRLRFGSVDALAGIDLDLAAGEQVAIVGASGAGKSSLLAVLNLGLRQDAGTYRFEDGDVAALPTRDRRRLRARIATVHQRHDLVGRSDVLRNVLAGRLGRWGFLRSLRTLIAPMAGDVADARTVLGRVGLDDRWPERADRLSGGQQQRVAVARALFQGADLLLADEPVAALDPVHAQSLLDLMTRTAREDGRTLVVSLHQPELALRFLPRVVGMNAGRIIFDLPAAEVTPDHLRQAYAGNPSPVPPPAETVDVLPVADHA